MTPHACGEIVSGPRLVVAARAAIYVADVRVLGREEPLQDVPIARAAEDQLRHAAVGTAVALRWSEDGSAEITGASATKPGERRRYTVRLPAVGSQDPVAITRRDAGRED